MGVSQNPGFPFLDVYAKRNLSCNRPLTLSPRCPSAPMAFERAEAASRTDFSTPWQRASGLSCLRVPSLGRAVQRETKRNPPPKSPASLPDQFHLPKARLTVSVQIQSACASQCRSAREASALLCCSSLTIKHWPIHVDQLLAWHCLALRTTMTGEPLTRKLCQSSPKSLQYSFDPNTSSALKVVTNLAIAKTPSSCRVSARARQWPEKGRGAQ